MDSSLYQPWGTRLNAQLIPYLANPKGVWASLSGWQWVAVLSVGSLLIGAAYFAMLKVTKLQNLEQAKPKWYVAPSILFLTAVLIIPIRGGFDRSPLNHSSVYFSEKLYANHAAYNYFWTFMYAAFHKNVEENPVSFMSEQECLATLGKLNLQNQAELPIYLKSQTKQPINVVLVILESFSNKVIEPLGGMKGLTPNLNQYCKEGISFSNCYASGGRSDKGISALLCAYPALMRASAIINFPDKMKNLDYMPRYFRERNYEMSFYYGGDVNFYNTRMLLIQAGVNNIISKDKFPVSNNQQKWGVPDEFLYQRMFEDLQKSKQPFMSMVYNISSHEPFDIPEGFERIKGSASQERYCNSIAYSDSCLGDFVSKLKASPLWKNTVVIITSDHTSLEPGPTTPEDLESFRIPMIWIGGAVNSSLQIDKVCNQNDLSATLVQQMGWKPKPSYFSQNMFGKKDFALFYNIDGWGFVSPQCAFYENIDSKKKKFFYGEDAAKKDSLQQFAKAYTQYLHNDFQKQ